MICGIHQPNFLPYLGFFDKIKKSDVFIIYDDAQFVARDYHNQNFILMNGIPLKLKVPVEHCPINTPINEVRIQKDGLIKGIPWKEYHLKNIEIAYHKSPNFDDVFSLLKIIYSLEFTHLFEFNYILIKTFCLILGIYTPIRLSSFLHPRETLETKSTKRLIELTQMTGADTYLSGPGGKGYLQEDLFPINKVKLIYQEFEHPTYKQIKQTEFVKNMSVLDYLFNSEQQCNIQLSLDN